MMGVFARRHGRKMTACVALALPVYFWGGDTGMARRAMDGVVTGITGKASGTLANAWPSAADATSGHGTRHPAFNAALPDAGKKVAMNRRTPKIAGSTKRACGLSGELLDFDQLLDFALGAKSGD